MVGLSTILLSERGLRVFGPGLLGLPEPEQHGAVGVLVAYDPEGVWFQDERLQRDNKMVLVKWEFIDAVLSDAPPPEASGRRMIGF